MADDIKPLEQIQAYAGADATPQVIYREDGQRVRSGRRHDDPRYLTRLAETVELWNNVQRGRQSVGRLVEAMSTSDFTYLFADAIDRQLLARYAETRYVWNLVVRRGIVPDFRAVKRMPVDGAEGLLDEVKQLAPYKAAALTDGNYGYSVSKRGRRVPISWEAMVNDDLGAFLEIPDRLARAARRSEEYFVTTLFVGTTGPLSTVYSVGNKNIVNATNAGGDFTAVNPPLSVDALRQGIAVLSNQVDADGQPIMIEALTLMVPPALAIRAQEIVNATELIVGTDATSGVNRRSVTANWARDIVRVAVNYYIPYVASSSNGSTSWFLFADPNSGRPAGELGFLRGHESPELFMKLPNQVRISGGGGDLIEDFDIDAVDYKVRHVFGGTAMDPKVTVASSGAGS
jgi:hypothetical protein